MGIPPAHPSPIATPTIMGVYNKLAGRLAESDPGLSILVIEGGQDNRGKQNIEHPAFFLDHLQPTSKNTLFYKGNKSEKLGGREAIVPSVAFSAVARPSTS